MATKSLTFADVATHNTKKDLYLVVHDKVYNASSFVDEHPGGEEVMLDVGGQDATEAFEDVGHSDEAREILNGMLVGDLKRVAGDPAPKAAPSTTNPNRAAKADSGIGSVGLYAFLLTGGALAYWAYLWFDAQKQTQQ
ncbi:hypothetical protein ANO11243_078990 [Dothideomycetidae sp. 11243]|nr:hypothetical protein ANO11243_078990 [fungal sp. No.11243]